MLGTSIAVADDGRGIDVAFDATKTLVWTDGATHSSWDVYAGDMKELRATGVYTQQPGSCDIGERRFGSGDIPAPGRCAFFLVSGNSLVESGLGTDSSGGIRPNSESCHRDFTLPEPAGTPVAVSGHCRGLVVSWPASPSPDVTIYRLRAGTSPAAPVYVWPVGGTATYIDGLADAATYYLSVVAVDAEGNESAPTEEIAVTTANRTTPQAPMELNVSEGSPGVVNALAWPAVAINDAPLPGDPASPAIRDLAGYRVYRSTGFNVPIDDAHRIADLDASHVATIDPVRACSRFSYVVTAMNTCGVESAPSEKVEVVAAAGPKPKAPAQVHVTAIGAANLVSWSPSTTDVEGHPIAAPSYVVERAGPLDVAPADADFRKIAVVDGTLHAIDRAVPPSAPGERLYYRVKAIDDCPE